MRSSAKLKEKFIQAVAIDTLATYYKKYSYNNKIFSAAEVRTNANKRADGVIAWKSSKRRTNVASIEAKSINTLRNLITKPHQKKIVRHSQQLSFAIIISVTMLVFGLGYRFVIEPLLIVFLLIGSIILSLSIERLLYKMKLQRHQKIDVIEQIRQYPANERWIAIGFDSYTKSEQLENLLKKCKDNGFGLLIVRDEKVAKMELLPKFENYPTGSDFLSFYKKETSIRKSIAGHTTFSMVQKSPSQRAYQYQQWTFIFFYLMILMFCSYLYSRPISKSRDLPDIPQFPPIVAPVIPTEAPTLTQDSLPIVPKQPSQVSPKVEASDPICLSKIKGKKYIVKVDVYETEDLARKKVAEINRLNKNLKSDYFWLPCYKTPLEDDGFCVYVYQPRSDKSSTERNLKRFKYIGKQADLIFEKAEVWKIVK